MGIIEFECGACKERWRSHMKTALELGLVVGETTTTLISGGETNVSQSN